jgi:hypothetical protein
MGRTSRPGSLAYLLREHERLFREYQHLRIKYEALPVPGGRFTAHHAHIKKVRQFSRLLANHRLALKYRLDGLI